MKRCELIFAVLLALLIISPFGFAQINFRESTFDQFGYPRGILDEDYTQVLQARSLYSFPKARVNRVLSYITNDDPHDVVNYYSQLCGQRFIKEGDRFIYIFSKVNELPASRIEIYSAPNIRIQRQFWPTRIDLYLVSYPISVSFPQGQNRTLEDLRKLAKRLTYEGALREDVARLEQEELGPDAIVYVVQTNDSFEKVYRFFRRRYGKLFVRQGRDGDIMVRDFEFDATRAVGLSRDHMELFIRVEENPMATDAQGNSQIYLGYTFIKYRFWRNK